MLTVGLVHIEFHSVGILDAALRRRTMGKASSLLPPESFEFHSVGIPRCCIMAAASPLLDPETCPRGHNIHSATMQQ